MPGYLNSPEAHKLITNIEKETIPAVKELTEAGAQVKHIDISSRFFVLFKNLLMVQNF